MKKTHITSTKRRISHLYHADTYSGGWLIRASTIANARRRVLKTHVRYVGHVVKRATKSQAALYPMLTT